MSQLTSTRRQTTEIAAEYSFFKNSGLDLARTSGERFRF